MSTYNGWTNYETWRVNLEMLDGMTLEDFGMYITEDDVPDDRDEMVDALSHHLAEYVCEMVEQDAKGFALDLALSFLAKVDWTEIADHIMDDHDAERTEQANTDYNTV